MKKVLLIMLMFVLPLQAFAAMERNFVHLVGVGGHSPAFVIKHISEHANFVLHHHDQHDGDHDEDDDVDDDGALHVDGSDKSVQHLFDSDQAGSMNLLFSLFSLPDTAPLASDAPILCHDGFRTRNTTPLLRPPRLPA